jgi:hypothetical protein
VLYADARLWLHKGWVDYLSPQLYWPIRQVPQSYPMLLAWWTQQNKKARHIWPGLYASGIEEARGADEIVNQVMVARAFASTGAGHIHFSMKALRENRGGIVDSLKAQPYAQSALVPASPWLDQRAPDAPSLKIDVQEEQVRVQWAHGDVDDVHRWIVYVRRGARWDYALLHRDVRETQLAIVEAPAEGDETATPQVLQEVAVSALDRLGNESAKARMPLSRLAGSTGSTGKGP